MMFSINLQGTRQVPWTQWDFPPSPSEDRQLHHWVFPQRHLNPPVMWTHIFFDVMSVLILISYCNPVCRSYASCVCDARIGCSGLDAAAQQTHHLQHQRSELLFVCWNTFTLSILGAKICWSGARIRAKNFTSRTRLGAETDRKYCVACKLAH